MKINYLDKVEMYTITPDILGLLIYINSNTTKATYIHDILDIYLDDYCAGLEAQGWIEFTKTGKTPSQKIRLSDKGKTFLKSIGEAPITNTACNIWDIVEKWYKKYELDSKVVNKTKTTFYINEFLVEKESEGKPYNEKMMEAVIKTYLGSFEDVELKYTKKTLNLFYDNKNAFAKKWSKEDCPIYDFIDNNGQQILKTYKNAK